MKNLTPSLLYRIIVDTDAYSGDFERESVAYATGQVGECRVGEEDALTAEKELPAATLAFWAKHILHIDEGDEIYCARPAQSWPTRGLFNSFGRHFPETPEGRAEALALHLAAIERTAQEECSAAGADRAAQEQARAKRERGIAQAKAQAQGPRRAAAFQSVAIELDAAPPQALVDSFVERMRAFLACPPEHSWFAGKRATITAVHVEQFTRTPAVVRVAQDSPAVPYQPQ